MWQEPQVQLTRGTRRADVGPDRGKIRFKDTTHGLPIKRCLSHMGRMFLTNAHMLRFTLSADVNPAAAHFAYMSDDSNIERTAAWAVAAAQ